VLRIAVAVAVKGKQMSLADDLKELEGKLKEVEDGNVVLKANGLKAHVQILRAKVMRDDPDDKQHIIPILDGIDEKLDTLIERLTRNPNPK